MNFKKRMLEEAFKDWAMPAALGAGATMLAQHEFADDMGGSHSWNYGMDKLKDFADHIKVGDGGHPDVSKLKETVSDTDGEQSSTETPKVDKQPEVKIPTNETPSTDNNSSVPSNTNVGNIESTINPYSFVKRYT